ncbi:lipopolysaccharide biosynthesis protein [Mycobacterium neglectum]|uniref:lipopolysaccharide biosynthesis protein n=1 Tax=Mycobacterium neglectum TaxID=242737 RepID=UPI0011456D95|nr:lipopolysaccharide biosynthesis protein [Mycobacterium neglectum]
MSEHDVDAAPVGLSAKLRGALTDPMMRNSLAIMTSTVLTSMLGYAFWLIAARLFSREVNGTAAATTSAIQATVLIASIGAAAALVEWLPRCTTALEWRQRVTTAMLVSIVTATVGAVFVVGVLGLGFNTLPQLATPAGATLFCAACAFFAVGLVIDYIAVAEHRGGLLLVRNMVLCGLRIPLIFIPVLALSGADSILFAWTVAAALSLVCTVATFGSRSGHSLRPSFTELPLHLRQMASSLIGQHLITVTAMLAGYVLPVVVYARLSATDNAYFYITWMLGSIFFIISPAISAALFVEGAANPHAMPQLVRRCFMFVGALLTGPMIVYLIGGQFILGLFGADYVVNGYGLLLVLTLSAIPDAITNIAVAVLRVTDRTYTALMLNGGMLAGCVIGAWIVLPSMGIIGVGVCWLVSQLAGAAWVIARWRNVFGGTAPTDGDVAERTMEDIVPVAIQAADH